MPRSVYTSGTRRSVTRLRLARLGRVHRSDLSHHVPNSWSSGRADTPVIRPAAASPVMEGHAFKPWAFSGALARLIAGSARCSEHTPPNRVHTWALKIPLLKALVGRPGLEAASA